MKFKIVMGAFILAVVLFAGYQLASGNAKTATPVVTSSVPASSSRVQAAVQPEIIPPSAAGTPLGLSGGPPISFSQRVETADRVVVARVEHSRSQEIREARLTINRKIKDNGRGSEAYLNSPVPLRVGDQVLLLVSSSRDEMRETSAGNVALTVFEISQDNIFPADGPNVVLAEAADRYNRVSLIHDARARGRELTRESITSLGTRHPLLVQGAALDLQRIPDVASNLNDNDHEVISQSILGTHNGLYYKRDLLDAMGATRSSRSVDAAVFSLRSANSANVREAVGRNLAFINDPKTVQLLLWQIQDPRVTDPEAQASIAHCLGAIRSSSAVPYLSQKARAGNKVDLRVESMLALGKIQDLRGLSDLRQNLYEPDPVVQKAALQALAWMDKPEAYNLLRQYESQATDPRMKLLAQMLLKVPKRTIPIY